MRNIFLEKSSTKYVGKTSPTPFSEKLKLSVSLNQWSKSFIQFAFIVCQVEGYRNTLKLSCEPLLFTSYQTFQKNIKRSGTSLPCFVFCIIFEERYFPCYILLIDQVSFSGCLYFVVYWAICELQLFVNQVVAS